MTFGGFYMPKIGGEDGGEMLTEQRKRLVEEYIKLRCKDQRQAAINAGYSPRSAAVQACEILKIPKYRNICRSKNVRYSAVYRKNWQFPLRMRLQPCTPL